MDACCSWPLLSGLLHLLRGRSIWHAFVVLVLGTGLLLIIWIWIYKRADCSSLCRLSHLCHSIHTPARLLRTTVMHVMLWGLRTLLLLHLSFHQYLLWLRSVVGPLEPAIIILNLLGLSVLWKIRRCSTNWIHRFQLGTTSDSHRSTNSMTVAYFAQDLLRVLCRPLSWMLPLSYSPRIGSSCCYSRLSFPSVGVHFLTVAY